MHSCDPNRTNISHDSANCDHTDMVPCPAYLNRTRFKKRVWWKSRQRKHPSLKGKTRWVGHVYPYRKYTLTSEGLEEVNKIEIDINDVLKQV